MSVIFRDFNFPLGDAATDFTALPENVYRPILQGFKDEFLAMFGIMTPYDLTFEAIKEFVLKFGIVNPYLNFYMDNFVMYLMLLHGWQNRESITVLAESFLIDGTEGLEGTDIVNPRPAANSGLEVFCKDIQKRQTRIKEDFDVIASTSKEMEKLSPMQRLYLLSKQGRNYFSGEFHTTLMPDYSPMPEDLSKIKSTLLKNKVDIVEMVNIENLDDLLSYELYHTLKMELPLRKCKYCNEYFIVHGRIDIEYCDRIKPGETKPCNIIGASRNYWGSKEDNPIYKEFQKAYKRNHSRRRVGTMSPNDFFHWSEEAREKLKECESGQIDLPEFKIWLGNKR